ncbi:MAG: alpha/beta fold hydrolase [Chloroflexi bacterium]|nr:alpha/beta fold hydrolase [Chloroflexota bacterium]
MSGLFREELVQTVTDDGVLHAGAIWHPVGAVRRGPTLLWTHGLTGSWDEPHAVLIGRALASRGFTVVAGNGRGHHVGTRLFGPSIAPFAGGALWELFSQADRDIGAWISFAHERLGKPVALCGHSYGAIKSVTYVSAHADQRVIGLCSASGPFRPRSRLLPEVGEVARARDLVAAGRGEEIVRFTTPSGEARTVGAAALVDRADHLPDTYGADSVDSPVSRVRCPLLALYGGDEPHIGTAADLATIRRNATGAPRVETALIDGADHVYTGRVAALCDVLERWMMGL